MTAAPSSADAPALPTLLRSSILRSLLLAACARLSQANKRAAFGPPFFMRHNRRVEHGSTNTSPSLLDNIPYLWWDKHTHL
jgi:hypothetical protein